MREIYAEIKTQLIFRYIGVEALLCNRLYFSPMSTKIFILSMLFLFSCSLFKKKNVEPTLPDSLASAVNSGARAEENSDRDEFQHPFETLSFFGIQPAMTVAEISPGAGYYTEILAPYLAKQGQYLIVMPRMTSRPSAIMVQNEQKLQDILIRYSAVQAKARIIPFEPMNKRNGTKAASVDMVLTFNNLHNWIATNTLNMSFKFIKDVLKPGGTFGIVQHRIASGKRNWPRSGYLTEKQVIAMAQKAGFRYVEKSEINANPKDTANYPLGVWTLPPFYRLGDKDHDKYEDIGESDRMTLKFIKPN